MAMARIDTILLLLITSSAVSSFHQLYYPQLLQTNLLSTLSSRGLKTDSSIAEKDDTSRSSSPHIVFPGGGIFFYWQAGAVTYLLENKYDLKGVNFTGASAGALTATLTVNDVNFEDATKLALKLAEEAHVWDRPLGLQGIWGGMIETWLDSLLPLDAVEKSQDKVRTWCRFGGNGMHLQPH